MPKHHRNLNETLTGYYLNFFLLIPFLAVVSAGIAHYFVTIFNGGFIDSIKYTASAIVRPDYQNIDITDVQKAGGWVEILSDNKVVYVLGNKLDQKTSYTNEELGAPESGGAGKWFVSNYSDNNFYYSSAAFVGDDSKNYICLVKIPIRNTQSGLAGLFSGSNLAMRFERAVLLNLFSTVFIFCLLLVLCIRMYGRITAKIIIRPLNAIRRGIASITAGDLSTRMDFDAETEFADIRDALNYMAGRLQGAEMEKRDMEENRKKLIMGISHDLKTPITTVYGYAKALSDGMVTDPEKQQRHLQYIRDKSLVMTKLIDDLFRYSTMEGSEYVLNRRQEDFAEFLRELIAENYLELENHGFLLELDIPEHPVPYSFDQSEMRRALTNIINNAIKYNVPGTALIVALTEEPGKLKLTLGDDGVGIADEIKGTIFNEFVRGDAARVSDGGSGLGLAIAKRIIELHGGVIRLDGGHGRGARFLIELPMRQPD